MMFFRMGGEDVKVLIFSLTTIVTGQNVLQRFDEIRKEVKKAKEDREYMKVINLREKAAHLVYDIKTAKIYKGMFPDRYGEYMNTVTSNLPYYTYSKEELLELYNLFPENREIELNIKRIYLNRSKSLQEVEKTLKIFPDLRAEDYSLRFVHDLSTLKKYNKIFPDSFNSSALKELDELIEKNRNIDQREKLDEIRKKVKKADHSSIVYSLKSEATNYVDGYQTAKIFKEIFNDLDQHDKFANIIINRLEYILKREELYKLTEIFPNQRLIDIKKMYLIKSTSLNQIEEALNRFPDLYREKAEDMAIYYVDNLESALRFKEIFPAMKRDHKWTLESIFKVEVYMITDIDRLDEVISRYPELKKYSIEKAFQLVNNIKNLKVYKDIFGNQHKTDRELLNKLDKEELLQITKVFNDQDIIKTAGMIYLKKAETVLDLENARSKFPNIEEKIVNTAIAEINSIEKAVQVKNSFPDQKEQIAKNAVEYVYDLNSIKLFRNHFYTDKYKEEIIKKMIIISLQKELNSILDLYSVNNKEQILNLNYQYRETETKVDQLRKENPRFNIQGEMIDRNQEDILLWGKAIPANRDYNTYGTLIDNSNIIVKNYYKDGFRIDFYNGGYHFLLGKEKGESSTGQTVPIWVYGDKPEKLKDVEEELNSIKKDIKKLKIN
ncbi:MAG: hypothetical protein K9K32_07100 [Halanaerobiales bacterium]|nr:hypothetical protein [Halanaerobiales bacterium]